MMGFEHVLDTTARAILKRELDEKERTEFLELGGALGMANVQDYLYMLMIFKRNEDRVNHALTEFQEEMQERFDEMGALEKKIDETLEASIDRILTDGARVIGRNMGEQIAREARDTLTTYEAHHFLRGQTAVTGVIMFLFAVAFALGAVFRFGGEESQGFLESILRLPAGLAMFGCAALYTLFWAGDYWRQIRNKKLYKARFVLQILVLIALLLYFLK